MALDPSPSPGSPRLGRFYRRTLLLLNIRILKSKSKRFFLHESPHSLSLSDLCARLDSHCFLQILIFLLSRSSNFVFAGLLHRRVDRSVVLIEVEARVVGTRDCARAKKRIFVELLVGVEIHAFGGH